MCFRFWLMTKMTARRELYAIAKQQCAIAKQQCAIAKQE